MKPRWGVAEQPKKSAFRIPGPETLCPPLDANSTTQTRRISYIESTGNGCLTGRQACGVESAARSNPGMEINVYTSATRIGRGSSDQQLIPGRVRSCSLNQMLTSAYSNVQFRPTDFGEQLKASPFRALHESGQMESSDWSVVQISDAIRLLVLQRDGGFYLDFDNMVFRPLHCLRNTMSYLEEAPNIENGVMVMDAGHPFLSFLIDYLVEKYDAKNRVCMGPPAVGAAFKSFCWTRRLQAATYACSDNSSINLIHPDAFFPVRHNQNNYFYSANLDGYDTQPMQRAYMTHVYLSSWGTKVHVDALYARMARQYCPRVWNLTRSMPLGF